MPACAPVPDRWNAYRNAKEERAKEQRQRRERAEEAKRAQEEFDHKQQAAADGVATGQAMPPSLGGDGGVSSGGSGATAVQVDGGVVASQEGDGKLSPIYSGIAKTSLEEPMMDYRRSDAIAKPAKRRSGGGLFGFGQNQTANNESNRRRQLRRTVSTQMSTDDELAGEEHTIALEKGPGCTLSGATTVSLQLP